MATQTFVTHTDMQALGQVQTSSQAGVTQKSTAAVPQTAILQSAQSGGQQFIVTIGDPSNNGDSGGLQQVQEVHVPTASAGAQQIIYQGGAGANPGQASAQYVTDTSALYSPSSSSAAASAEAASAASGLMQYTDYSQSMYTPVSGTTYYTQGPGSQMTSGITQLGVQAGQILTHGGNTYLVQGGAMDADGTPLAHTTRASPATADPNDPRNSHFDVKSWQREVQWLIDNYETAEGVSLPRSTLYNHYLRHCQEQKIDPMNPASFGKLIRSVFLGLRTRRLGTRGNSKYHYYGIRIKATSPLNQFTDDTTMAMRQQPMNPANKRFKSSVGSPDGGDGSQQGGEGSQQHQHQQFLGDASGAIPNFDAVEVDKDLPEGISQEDVDIFEHLYQQHCEGILDIVVNLQFTLIEDLWQSFWRVKVKQEIQQNGGPHEDESRLSKEKLYIISRYPPVHKFVRKSDYAFYQALVEVLIPDVLRPIPSSLTQAIRNFAKSLEGWLKTAMVGVPEEMVRAKLGAVGAFAQTLRRYTSLNHLAQAARAVLQNTTQISQMLADLNRVDFANVQEQASWVCQCEDGVVHQLEQDFKKTLQGQNSLEQWAMWLESVVNRVLQPHEGRPDFPKAARQFLLKWSFYSSMVIRDLTLRSAASFGSFHLIRLLYDEYMFYLVEHKVAAATGETPIAVMGEVKQLIDLGSVMALGTLESDSSSKPASSAATVVKPATVTAATAAAKVKTATITTQPGKQNHTTLAQLTTVTTGGSTLTSGGQPTKTIVVVPMSAAAASGDQLQHTITKKMKLSN